MLQWVYKTNRTNERTFHSYSLQMTRFYQWIEGRKNNRHLFAFFRTNNTTTAMALTIEQRRFSQQKVDKERNHTAFRRNFFAFVCFRFFSSDIFLRIMCSIWCGSGSFEVYEMDFSILFSFRFVYFFFI